MVSAGVVGDRIVCDVISALSTTLLPPPQSISPSVPFSITPLCLPCPFTNPPPREYFSLISSSFESCFSTLPLRRVALRLRLSCCACSESVLLLCGCVSLSPVPVRYLSGKTALTSVGVEVEDLEEGVGERGPVSPGR